MTICCVPNCCSSSNSRKRDRNIHFFGMPSDDRMFLKWKLRIKRGDRDLKNNDKICSLHFQEDFILKTYDHKMPDGSICSLARGKWSLKSDAIPTLFPNSPVYLSTEIKKRKSPKKRGCVMPIAIPRKRLKISEIDLEREEPPTPATQTEFDTVAEAEAQKIKCISDVLNSLKYDTNSCWIHSVTSNSEIVFFWCTTNFKPVKRIIVSPPDFKVQVFIGGDVLVKIPEFESLKEKSDIGKLLNIVQNMKICSEMVKNSQCLGIANRSICTVCKELVQNQKEKEKRAKRRQIKRGRFVKRSYKRCRRLKKKVDKLKEIMVQCSQKNEKTIFDNLDALPLSCNMREMIINCINTSKALKNGKRFTRAWIYECLLLKIKGSTTYNYLRRQNILPLPSPSTIYRYLKKLKPSYGFQPAVFEVLKAKAKGMRDEGKRGVLLLDEMKISESVYFDKNTFQVLGYTDLGKYTPSHQKKERADHALVILYQLFQSNQFQVLGAFLNRSAAKGDILYHLIIEAITLLENVGFKVDGVTTDGAQWNRGMWRLFGVETKQKENQNYNCPHPLDEERKLFFFSDFPHLIKSLRNWVVDRREFDTPDGKVKKSCWERLLESEEQYGIKKCPKLTPACLNPKPYERMNVAKAYKLFGFDVGTAMKALKIEDSQATYEFIFKIEKLIKAMSSKSPKGALWKDSEEYETVQSFITYLENWKKIVNEKKGEEKGPKNSKEGRFITNSTHSGLKVTLSNTLELFEFLTSKCGYKYLMTAKLNQDNLEKFFSMIHGHGGHNDHPDPKMFIFIFRLLMLHSIAKPPKGCNVTGEELFQSMIDIRDEEVMQRSEASDKEKWKFVKTSILTNACSFEDQDDCCRPCPSNVPKGGDTIYKNDYFYGFIGKHILKIVNKKYDGCRECLNFISSENHDFSELLELRDKYKVLIKPSLDLCSLLDSLEKEIMEHTKRHINSNVGPGPDFVEKLIDHFHDETNLTLKLIGCNKHKFDLTSNTMDYYIAVRLNFIFTEYNKIANLKAETKNLKKGAKLK